jgi:hypothetical protein
MDTLYRVPALRRSIDRLSFGHVAAIIKVYATVGCFIARAQKAALRLDRGTVLQILRDNP